MPLNRRQFVYSAAAAYALGRRSRAADINPTFTIDPSKAVAHVPADFTGLSYESSQLIHPSFFNADNKALIGLFRTLGERGVLRLGGNLSEFTVWSATDAPLAADDSGTEGPDPGTRTIQSYTISPRTIHALNGFLGATNWSLIYGLNLARGTADAAAEEAAFVAKVCGPRLLAFQFGNEPDLFKHNDDPKDHWKYPEFIDKWNAFAKAVLATVPNAPLAGPDTSFKPEWVGNFAADTKGRTKLITAHYYAEGPPTNPDMTIDRLLTDRTKFKANILSAVELADKAHMPYRMSEGNTCYNAGKKGVSDTFASALWAGDFMAQIAAVGGTGVNLHGGGNGLYTPIAGSIKEGFTARPDYYGMLFARPLFGSTVLQTELSSPSLNVTAYAMLKQGKVTVLAFNKSDRDTVLEISLPKGYNDGSAKIMRLTGPAIDATSGVELGGATVASDGTWKPVSTETIRSEGGRLSLPLAKYSAASASFS